MNESAAKALPETAGPDHKNEVTKMTGAKPPAEPGWSDKEPDETPEKNTYNNYMHGGIFKMHKSEQQR